MNVVIYDKWLHSLGGGEVVACNMAKILKEKGYDVLFISGKKVSAEVIFDKLKIDMTGIKFETIWNDEIALKRLIKGKDLFINISFMDYSIGFAKKNIYYANFPTKPYSDFEGLFLTRILVPIISRFIKPIESLSQIEAPLVINSSPAYILRSKNTYALPNLNINKPQIVTFKIYFENFYKSFLENVKITLDNADVIVKKVEVNHNRNTIQFVVKFLPKSQTAYLNIFLKSLENYHSIEEGKVYLLYPKIRAYDISNFLFRNLFEKIVTRLRAGIFMNIIERLCTYQGILTYSLYAKKWIKRYWKINAFVIAPPVDLFFKKKSINFPRKNNWICSVGRFFTLGHGKKQEILIEAFKKLHDNHHKNWELHLVGGLGDEPSSIAFFKYLKEKSKDYPIFFHINASRQEVEDIYLKSKIYWHGTGYGENENINPIRFEHFGIAPIEALSAMCVPILFNGGGLKEIISVCNLSRDKNLFSSINQLVENTVYFQKDKNRKLNWEYIFKQADKYYSLEAFKKNFLQLLAT